MVWGLLFVLLFALFTLGDARHLRGRHHHSHAQPNLEEVVDGEYVDANDVTKLYPFFGEFVSTDKNELFCGSAYHGVLGDNKHYMITAAHCMTPFFSWANEDVEVEQGNEDITKLKKLTTPLAVDFGRETASQLLGNGVGRVAVVSAFVPTGYLKMTAAKAAALKLKEKFDKRVAGVTVRTEDLPQWANWETKIPKQPSQIDQFEKDLWLAALREFVDKAQPKLEAAVSDISSKYSEELDIALVELAEKPPDVWSKENPTDIIPLPKPVPALKVTDQNSLSKATALRLVGFGKTCHNPFACSGRECTLINSDAMKFANTKSTTDVDGNEHRFATIEGPCPGAGDSGSPVLVATQNGFAQIGLIKGAPSTLPDGWKHYRTGVVTSLLEGSPARGFIQDVEFFVFDRRH